MPVARREVGAGLRDADDRLAGAQFLRRQAEVHVALEIERRHAGIFRIVEPELRAQRLALGMRGLGQFLRGLLGHDFSPGAPHWNGLISRRECAELARHCK
jgi:hypothetical protein